MKTHAIKYFSGLFTSEEHQVDPELLNCIPNVVTTEQNSSLCAIPNSLEIHKAVCSLNSSSSPGPDGFSVAFFTSVWDIIAQDFCEAVKGFFQGYPLPRQLKHRVKNEDIKKGFSIGLTESKQFQI